MKKVLKVPVQLHTHYTTGVASMTYKGGGGRRRHSGLRHLASWRWAQASPQPRFWVAALEGTPYDTGLDLKK
jgi:oxaloacetate decarboxylase alpha subunit